MNQYPQHGGPHGQWGQQQGGQYGQWGQQQGPHAGMVQGMGAVDFNAVQERARAFVWKAYAWMSVGLGITGVVAMVLASLANTPLRPIIFNPVVYFGSMAVTLVLVFVLSAARNRLDPMVAGGLFFVYAALNGIWMSAIFLVYTASSIASTFFVCAGMFAATSAFGYVTKRDLTGVGHFALMGLIGLILASIVNIFVASHMLYWLVTYAGVIIFVALTAYDTQKLRQLGGMGMDAKTEAKASIQGALMLYLDFINLFLFLLRLFGNRR
jgi:FtsH-binding integral membrane protein